MHKRKLVISVAVLAILALGAKTKLPTYNANTQQASDSEAYHSDRFNKRHFFKQSHQSTPHFTRSFSAKPFAYQNGKRKLVLGKLDDAGRATGSHIQLKESQAPTAKRSAYLTVNPSGWHNYKFTYQGKTNWLFNRGHLVGYQFSGLNNCKQNLVTETMYLNQGSLKGMDQSNDRAMLFYENRLRKWMIQHPSCSLDYSVIPIYRENELVPRSVKLTFVGYNKRGGKMRIKMPTNQIKYMGNVGQVILKNSSPNATIDYATGRAKIAGSKYKSWKNNENRKHFIVFTPQHK